VEKLYQLHSWDQLRPQSLVQQFHGRGFDNEEELGLDGGTLSDLLGSRGVAHERPLSDLEG
jgi:hypothetical protein